MAIFADVIEEWKKASPKEKLLIGGVSVGALGLALYLHSKSSSSSVAGTGTTGLPTSLQAATGTGATTQPPDMNDGPPAPAPITPPAPKPPVLVTGIVNPGPIMPPAPRQAAAPPATKPTTSSGGSIPKPTIGSPTSPAYTGTAPPPQGPPTPPLPPVHPGPGGPAGPPPGPSTPNAVLPLAKTQQPTITANVAARIIHPAALAPIAAHNVPVPKPPVKPAPAPAPKPVSAFTGPK